MQCNPICMTLSQMKSSLYDNFYENGAIFSLVC
jgi:hypothetical protein